MLTLLRRWIGDRRRSVTGEGTGRLGRWEHPDRRAGEQRGDVHALDVEGDPRGGMQSDAWHADPREIVVEGDVAMSGPGGAPQDELEPDEVDREPDPHRR